MTEEQSTREALDFLRPFGAESETFEELLRYLENPYEKPLDVSLPLTDEAHVAAWREYVAEAEEKGAVATLRNRQVRMRFPVREGMNEEPAYRLSTRSGEMPPVDMEPAEIVDPEGVELLIAESIAGAVPVIRARDRRDFVTLVQVLARRNEPQDIPDSMGACLVKGLTNWDRVARYREAWAAKADDASHTAWQKEFRRIVPQKELYKDTLLILSHGPYSSLSAADAGRDEAEWLSESLTIRQHHECFHYLTLRLFGLIRSNLLDEVLADLMGLLAAHDEYREELALTLLERRLSLYQGDLSENAFGVIRRLAPRVVSGVARRVHGAELHGHESTSAFALKLARLGLRRLAQD